MRSSKHYRNLGRGGETSFVTTTCLDFVPVFADPILADLMAASIAEDCRRANSYLHAFVVMSHHIHFLTTPPEGTPITNLVQRIKANSARRIRPRLSSEREHCFDQQTGLNRHSFWQYSFRSYPVTSPEQFHQKMDYIHTNPSRSRIVTSDTSYRWSSLRFYDAGLGSHLHELDLAAIIDFYAPDGIPRVSAARRRQPR